MQVQAIIDAGRAESDLNDGTLATPQELMGVIDRQMRSAYSAVAKANPRFFHKVGTVSPDADAGGWRLPADLEVLISIFWGSERVHIVPLEEPEVHFPPRVYETGRVLVSLGEPGDPPELALLRVSYSHQHPSITSTNQSLHASWPVAYNRIPILAVARHLASKDGREGEAAQLTQELAAEMAALVEHAQNHVLGFTMGNQ